MQTNDEAILNEHRKETKVKNDPGAHPFPFGVHKGKRLDSVPDGLRYWGVHPLRQTNIWYAPLTQANIQYEEHLLSTREPGAWRLPSGKHQGKRLDEVPSGYRWWCANVQQSDNVWYPWFVKANKRYQASLRPGRSPGSETIWFGRRYKDLRFDVVYQRKEFRRFHFDPKNQTQKWFPRLEDLRDRYEAWLQNHKREYRPRRPAVVENPVGEAIGPWDDREGSADPDEEYERDSFIVSDDEGDYDEDTEYRPTQEEIGSGSEVGTLDREVSVLSELEDSKEESQTSAA
ncbi:hypothetical protein BV22DRAFT_764327 [Leucogyrophana mollusca]|uniref:Uncharacterized protein n=1 Tax=Leucogyrophana mollusca TaxID=85980 RepID=A0ACB8B5A7_9AGAM|nr:hypothetical protein BV22DRAFT_764327 [Leucogyrophana mollusca]